MNTSLHKFSGILIWVLLYLEVTDQACHFEFYANEDKEKGAKNISDYLDYYNRMSTLISSQMALIVWKFNTNITKENSMKSINCSMTFDPWSTKQKEIVARFTDLSNLTEAQKRIIKFINETIVFSDEKAKAKLRQSSHTVEEIYATAQVVLDNGTRLTAGESGPEHFFRKETDYDKLAEVWKKWRDVTGKKIRPYYIEQIKLLNERAKENGFSDSGRLSWFLSYEDANFTEKVLALFEKLKPLYQELHAYVRHKLSHLYPNRFPANGPVPAHLFRNIWAQEWNGLFDLVKPFRNVSETDITKTMLAQKWTIKKIVQTSEEFYTSMGLHKMTKLFWKNSIFENPGDRGIDCHPSAWDMSSPDDFRISMCATVSLIDFITIHHEMGHIEYHMCYKDQPSSFRTGANPGFHEAIGDTISLSVMTNSHLRKLGLYPHTNATKEDELNELMRMALSKVVFLPFGLLMDVWLWRISNGSVPENELNKEWWRLRRSIQGVVPPVDRSEADFDPASKFHVAQRITYIRYFISFILQFQFYAAMCNKSGHVGPLHQCDFYKSKQAGASLRSLLELGASIDWREALEKMTGQRDVSTDAFERYFSPLNEWLKAHRKTVGYPIGW